MEQKSEFAAHLFAVKLVERLVEFFKGLLTTDLLNFCSRWLYRIGHFALLAAAGLGFLFALIYAAKANKFTPFFTGIQWILIILVVQYIAHKFGTAGEALIKKNPSYMMSKVFMNCLAFLLLLYGVFKFFEGLYLWISGNPFGVFVFSLAQFAICVFAAMVYYNPSEINVELVEEQSAGQEAIGIITLLIKGFMRLVPILFGALILFGLYMEIRTGLYLFKDPLVAGGAWDMMQGEAVPMIYKVALLPFLSYIGFVVLYLAIDVIRALLSLHKK